MKSIFAMLMVSLLATSGHATAIESPAEAVHYLQQEWAIDNYQLKGEDQDKAFSTLIEKSDALVEQFPASAEVLIWRGIIYSTYAGVKGGLSALGYAKSSKADLEKALSIQPDALQGSAYTSLGTLYFKVPGWPIGFGDDKKARTLFEKALQTNPDGIDANYFYAQFLMEEDDYVLAQTYLQRALSAPPRPGRELADLGRKHEIREALAEVRKHL